MPPITEEQLCYLLKQGTWAGASEGDPRDLLARALEVRGRLSTRPSEKEVPEESSAERSRARTAVSEATFSLEPAPGGNGAVRSPVFEEVSSMLRRIAVLALLLGILPAAVQALPRGSGPDAPAAVHSAWDWLLRLGSLLDNLWNRATENTGMSIDHDGKPQSLPQDPSGDTGVSIDPHG